MTFGKRLFLLIACLVAHSAYAIPPESTFGLPAKKKLEIIRKRYGVKAPPSKKKALVKKVKAEPEKIQAKPKEAAKELKRSEPREVKSSDEPSDLPDATAEVHSQVNSTLSGPEFEECKGEILKLHDDLLVSTPAGPQSVLLSYLSGDELAEMMKDPLYRGDIEKYILGLKWKDQWKLFRGLDGGEADIRLFEFLSHAENGELIQKIDEYLWATKRILEDRGHSKIEIVINQHKSLFSSLLKKSDFFKKTLVGMNASEGDLEIKQAQEISDQITTPEDFEAATSFRSPFFSPYFDPTVGQKALARVGRIQLFDEGGRVSKSDKPEALIIGREESERVEFAKDELSGDLSRVSSISAFFPYYDRGKQTHLFEKMAGLKGLKSIDFRRLKLGPKEVSQLREILKKNRVSRLWLMETCFQTHESIQLLAELLKESRDLNSIGIGFHGIPSLEVSQGLLRTLTGKNDLKEVNFEFTQVREASLGELASFFQNTSDLEKVTLKMPGILPDKKNTDNQWKLLDALKALPNLREISVNRLSDKEMHVIRAHTPLERKRLEFEFYLKDPEGTAPDKGDSKTPREYKRQNEHGAEHGHNGDSKLEHKN